MRREFSVEANVGAPQVAYRESIKKYIEEEDEFYDSQVVEVSMVMSI